MKAFFGAVVALLLSVAILEMTVSSAAVAATPDQVGQWSSVLNWPLVAVHSALQPNGQVLVWDAFGYAPDSERLWDPATGTFVPVPYTPNLFCSGHSELGDGRTIVFGGHIASNIGLKDTTLFDPSSNTWTRGPDMTVGRWYPTATTLANGQVLVVSGDNMILGRSGVPQPFKDTSNTLPEVYDPVTNTIRDLPSAQRYIPLYPFMFVMPDGRVFDAGPDTVNRALDVNTGTWTTIANSPFDGGSAVMYRSGKILKTGTWGDSGVDYPGDGRAAVIDLNQTMPTWRSVASMHFARQFHNLVALPDGNVLAIGGATSGGGIDSTKAVLTPELWNAASETWTDLAPMQTPRMYHATYILLPDGRVLVAGGGRKGGAIDYPSAEIYSPPYLFKGARPTITSAPSTVTYGSSFTIDTPDASSIASVSLIRNPSMTHAFDENQRFQLLNFTQGAGKLTVTAPATGNLAPPGVYMVFVVNGNGVPSVAKFVRMQANLGDLTPPTVSVTTPAAGASLSGLVSIAATAGDNVAVGSVQFKVDGNNIGAPDTTAPYSITWDTTAAANGAHSVTAVATDTSGNTTTSTGVPVTVVNSGPAGLVAAYSMDAGSGTTLTDLSGNHNTGTLSNTSWTSTGKYGGALSFNGTNAWVTIPDSNTLDLTTGMTLEAWVNPTTLGTSWRTVMLKETTGNMTYSLYANRNTQVPNTQVNIGGEQNVNGSAQLPLNTWTHLAASYDGANLKLYTNGLQTGTIPLAGAIATSTGALRIGGNNVWPEWFSGQIDEVRVYNKALTQAEIQADLNKAVGVPDTTPPSAPTNFQKTGATATSISTSWTAATDNVAVASYNLYDGATKVANTSATSFTLSGLGCGTSHNLAVEAVDSSNNVSTSKATLTASTNACDTTPPTVTLTAPSAGATITGTINVTANATDNDSVAGVQFKLDGNNLGAEDTTSPYSVAWDTTSTSNGSHTLTATARDASNNTSNSGPTTITVNNIGPPPPTGLVAAYSMDAGSGTTLTDLSGNNNTGTLSNTSWTSTGKYGGALSFNGTNAWVTIPDSNTLDLTTGMTLEAWVNPTTLGTSWRTAIFKEQAGNYAYALYANTGTSNPSANGIIAGNDKDTRGGTVPLNSWTHLAATYDGSALKLYVNGTQVSSLAATGSLLTSTGALRIGGNNVWPEWFSGQIDEVRVYNKALTQAEIQADLNKAVGVPDTTPPSAPTNFQKTGATATSISTSWTAATDNVAVASYNLYDGATKVANTSATSFTLSGLGCGTSHNLAVEAVDSSNNVSTSKATLTASTNACDTTPPTVTLTAPSAGATITGTINVTANATDNDSVAGVQFKLDGNNLGAEDTTSPYSVAWDTTSTSNGSHTLTATARDASNNTSNSGPTTITVNNIGPPPPTGLVAAYSMDAGSGTTLTDLSGNNNTGTLSNTSWTSTGKYGGALSFNGTNAWVTIPDSNTLDLTTGMTLEAWVNPTTLGTSWRTVMLKETTGNMTYSLYANRNTQVPNTQVNIGGEQNVNGSAQLPLNTWTHLAASYDGANLKLYTNGLQTGTIPLAGAIATSTGALRIGGNNVWPEWFSGQIDEVRVYNKALTQAEIQADSGRPIG